MVEEDEASLPERITRRLAQGLTVQESGKTYALVGLG